MRLWVPQKRDGMLALKSLFAVLGIATLVLIRSTPLRYYVRNPSVHC